jgi:anti-sigma factor ChrR (cupin superfamily)
MDTEHRCFCELAPFYALGVLGMDDRVWIEQQIAADSDLALELAELEAVVAKITYATPPVVPSPQLKNRLFERLGRSLPTSPEAEISNTAFPGVIARLLERSANTLINSETVRYQDIQWKPHRVPGVMVARLHMDLETREAVGLLKAEPGMIYPLHTHNGVEEIFMLQGDLIIDGRVYGSGDYIRSLPNSAHAPESHTGCMFFFRACIDDEYPEAALV